MEGLWRRQGPRRSLRHLERRSALGLVVLVAITVGLLAALREGDYSVRGRGELPGDPLGEVLLEVNALGDTLREQRLGAMEAGALLGQVMEAIDVAVLAFDAAGTLKLVNRAGARLVGLPRAAPGSAGRSARLRGAAGRPRAAPAHARLRAGGRSL